MRLQPLSNAIVSDIWLQKCKVYFGSGSKDLTGARLAPLKARRTSAYSTSFGREIRPSHDNPPNVYIL